MPAAFKRPHRTAHHNAGRNFLEPRRLGIKLGGLIMNCKNRLDKRDIILI
jgi:hypothetical protein